MKTRKHRPRITTRDPAEETKEQAEELATIIEEMQIDVKILDHLSRMAMAHVEFKRDGLSRSNRSFPTGKGPTVIKNFREGYHSGMYENTMALEKLCVDFIFYHHINMNRMKQQEEALLCVAAMGAAHRMVENNENLTDEELHVIYRTTSLSYNIGEKDDED